MISNTLTSIYFILTIIMEISVAYYINNLLIYVLVLLKFLIILILIIREYKTNKTTDLQ